MLDRYVPFQQETVFQRQQKMRLTENVQRHIKGQKYYSYALFGNQTTRGLKT